MSAAEVPQYVEMYASSVEEPVRIRHRHFYRSTTFLLLIVALVSAFFTQYQPVTLCVFGFHGAFLGFIYTSRKFVYRWLGTLLVTVGLVFSMPQLFRVIDSGSTVVFWDWASFGYVCGISAGIAHILLFLAIIHAHLATSSSNWMYLLPYPVLVASCYSLMGKLSPLGMQLPVGYGISEWLAIVQVVSLFGITGLNFFILLIATCAVHTTVLDRGNVNNKSRKVFSLRLALTVLVAAWMYGSIRLLWPYLYQRDIGEVAAPELVNGACVVWGGHLDPIEQTKQLLESDSSIRFVLWSEAAGDTTYYDDRDSSLASQLNAYQTPRASEFTAKISQISTQYNATIGATYTVWAHPTVVTDGYMYNKIIFMDPILGDVLDYSKRHPVPIIENAIIASSDKIHKGNSTNIGYFNAAICFDFDFPDYIRTGTSTGLLIQTANTWGIVGNMHSVGSYNRAIENGAYLVRCGSEGVAGVWDYYGNPVMYQATSGPNIIKFQIPFNPPRMWTLYAHGGFAIDYVLYGLGLLFIILAVLTLNRRRPEAKRMPPLSAA